jgi:4'-phosphopantetheinyl transferase
MPIVQRTNLNQNTVLAVWKITESREVLYAQLSDRISDAGRNLHDNIHWLASRNLLQELFPESSIELLKDEFNKPSLLINRKQHSVSITHSYEYAAVMVSSSQTVALDLEKIDERVNRVARKFIRTDERFDELSYTTRNNDSTTVYYTIIWSAKETLYKYYSKKELDFLENLRVLPFTINPNGFVLEGCITKQNFALNLPIEVRLIEGYVLTYSAGE